MIYFTSRWISEIFFDNQLTSDLIFLSFFSGCLEYLFIYLTTLLNAQVKSSHYSIVIVLRSILGIIFSLYFILFKDLTFLARINAIILSQIIILVILFFLTKNLFRFGFSVDRLQKSISLSFPLIPQNLIGIIQTSFDKTMLANFIGTNSVGIYSFSERFSLAVKMVSDALGKVWDPYFLNQAMNKSLGYKERIVHRFYNIIYLIMFVGICIIFFSEELIILLTNEDFYSAMFVVPIYVYFFLFGAIGKISMGQINYSKKMIYLLPTSIVSVIVNVILNLLLIPFYGILGAAISTAISSLVINIIQLYFGMKLFPLKLGNKIFVLYLIVILFTGIAYSIMLAKIAFLFKFCLKVLAILIFLIIGFKLNFVNISDLKNQNPTKP